MSLDEELARLDVETSDARAELDSLSASLDDSLAALGSEESNLAQQIADLNLARGYVLRAPVEGVFSSLEARVG